MGATGPGTNQNVCELDKIIKPIKTSNSDDIRIDATYSLSLFKHI